MGELSLKARLQPSLLDRLTDDSPDERTETYHSRVIDEARLREVLRRDLSWLLNTTHLTSIEDLSEFPEVSRSVLNYGIPDLAGRTLSSVDPRKLEGLLKEAILRFEPRLLRNSLTVRVVSGRTAAGHNGLVFDIEAELWSQPAPVALVLQTEIDLEDGSVRVEEQGRH
ncbi:MAG TPA: type VI secretion system baseplate subunit TssE [Polyangiales bacterium]|nr:type VI secretion system baseplate subunit TssE [Polyangiales bacterium]